MKRLICALKGHDLTYRSGAKGWMRFRFICRRCGAYARIDVINNGDPTWN